MNSTKISVNFVIPAKPITDCIQFDLGTAFDNFWHLTISSKKDYIKKRKHYYLDIERSNCVPNLRLVVDIQFINVDTKKVFRLNCKGMCNKRVTSFLLRRDFIKKMSYFAKVIELKGEIQIHIIPESAKLIVPQTLLTLSSDLSNLYCNQKFSDVIIQCGSKAFPAHKNILIARCPVFAEMLLNSPTEAKLDVNDLDPAVLRTILYYIYSGKTKERRLTFEAACDLVGPAKKYKLNELVAICADVFNRSFLGETVFDYFYKYFDKYEALQCYMLDYMVKNIAIIEDTKQWKDFKDDRPNEAAEILKRRVDQECHFLKDEQNWKYFIINFFNCGHDFDM